MGKSLLELQQLTARKAAELHDIFEKTKTGVIDERGQPLFDMDSATLTDVKARNLELNDINIELEAAKAGEVYLNNQRLMQGLNEIDRTIPHDGSGGSKRGKEVDYTKSIGQMVVDHNGYALRPTGSKRFDVELNDVDLKTLMTTSAGWSAPNPRTNIVILSAQRRPMVSDLIPQTTTTNSVIKYMEETTFTNAAATVAEGAVKPESALAFTERTSNVQKIATWLPITEEQMDDVPQVMSVINDRLMLMLMTKEEDQVLTGDGTGNNLDGFTHRSGVQSQARGSDDGQDAIYKAMVLVRWTGFAEPSGVVIHPTNWQAIRLQRTSTGLYIFGDPAQPGEERLWGKPVVVTPAITLNTALTGDFPMYSHISRKMGVRVDVADQHDVYFIYNKLVIRIEERLSLEIYRNAAFCKVTGLV